MKKKGISLITLVITIIIIIILAGIVILNIVGNNPLDNATKAKIYEDYSAFNSDLTLTISNEYLKNNMLDISTIDSTEDNITELIPSMKGEKILGIPYDKIYIVVDGQLKLKTDLEVDKFYPDLSEGERDKIKDSIEDITDILEKEKREDSESNVAPDKPIIKLYYSDKNTEITSNTYTKEYVIANISTNVITTGYTMEYSSSLNPEWIKLDSNNTEVELNQNQTIFARIIDNAGNEIYVSSQKVEIIDKLEPVIEEDGIELSDVNETGFKVTVSATDKQATDAYACSNIKEYEYHVIENSVEKPVKTSSENSYIIDNLKINSTYEVYVVVRDNAGNTVQSDIKPIVTSEAAPLYISVDTKATNLRNEDGTEKPLIATIGIGNLPNGYHIEYSLDGKNYTKIYTKEDKVEITENCTITAKLVKTDGTDEQGKIEEEVLNIDTLIPSKAEIEYESSTINSISVILKGEDTAANEVSSCSGVQRYEIYVGDSLVPYIIESNNLQEKYKVTGLNASNTYKFYVKVIDNAGNSKTSETKEFRTLYTYNVTYNLNGGSGTFNTQSKVEDVNLTLHTSVPTKSGYTFTGWLSSSDSVTYSKGGSYTKNAATTMTAQWIGNEYKVAYNGNGSTSGSMSNSSHTYGTPSNLTTNAYKKEYIVIFNHNYSGTSNVTRTSTATFNGWATSASGTKAYNDKASISTLATSGIKTLYAVWSAMPSVTYTPSRSGYTFNGWYTNSACTTQATGTGIYTPSKNITLYAKWTINHQHTSSCFHSHGSSCYKTVVVHAHSDSCYTTHTHGTACYTQHSHGDSCYTKSVQDTPYSACPNGYHSVRTNYENLQGPAGSVVNYCSSCGKSLSVVTQTLTCTQSTSKILTCTQSEGKTLVCTTPESTRQENTCGMSEGQKLCPY